MRFKPLLAFVLLFSLSCGDSETPKPAEDSGVLRDGGRDAEVVDPPVACRRNEDCDDGLYCNGEERCDDEVCERGVAIECDDDIECTNDVCTETTHDCRFVPPDEDGDGHYDIRCQDAEGDPFGDDCDDLDALRFPGNIEICDQSHHDEDCDPLSNGERDEDGDEFYDRECCNPANDEPAAELLCGPDCDDLKPTVNPETSEVCDKFDNDCDGEINEGVLVEMYPDTDFDLHGDMDAEPTLLCPGAARFALEPDDCDDADPEIFTGQLEICDEKDNNCVGGADEKRDEAPWYLDEDGDNFGAPSASPPISCEPIPGRVLNKHDCNDGDPAINFAATERCDGIDNDCRGGADFEIGTNNFEDDDGDELADDGCGAGAEDCDDRNAATGFGVDEICDGRDNDCDDSIDENVVATVWYVDRDRDNFGDVFAPQEAFCGIIPGRTPYPGDCNDADDALHPKAIEACDGVNQDCDSQTDEGPAHKECSLPHAESYCLIGRCRIDICEDGYSNCDGMQTNGCEHDAQLCPGGGGGGMSGGTGGMSGGAGGMSGGAGGMSGGAGGMSGGTGGMSGGASGASGASGEGGTGGGPVGPIACDGTLTPGNRTIANAADLAAMAGITCLAGDLTINNTALTNLDGLSSLQWVGGNLSIYNNTSLTSVSGLASLTTVGGFLSIQYNHNVVALDGLGALTTVGTYLTIYSNNKLEDLSGLDALETIGTYLQLAYNNALTALDDFDGLFEVGGYLNVNTNNELASIAGFGSLTSVASQLQIFGNPKLTSIEGFVSLRDTGDDVELHDNVLLATIGGFDELDAIEGDLLIYNNAALQNVNGFPQLTGVGTNVQIYNNSHITAISGFQNLDAIGGTLLVTGNVALASINGFSSLSTIDNDVVIQRNLALNSIAGLTTGLSDIGDMLSISANPVLSACQVNDIVSSASPATNQSCCNAGCNTCSALTCMTPGAGNQSGVFIGNATIGTTSELALFVNATQISGNMAIASVAGLNDLTPLSGLTTVTGNVNIDSNPALSSVDGLETLTSIGGTLQISSNAELGNVDALDGLTTIDGGLVIHYNNTLGNLSGLSALRTVGQHVSIYSNTTMTTLGGLRQLESIGHYLTIAYNNNLQSIDDLVALEEVGTTQVSYITLISNGLTAINGLNALQTVNGYVDINSHNSLATINGFNGLDTVSGAFSIHDNNGVQSVEGFGTLTDIGGALNIYGNANLVSVGGFDRLDSVGADVRISGNADLLAIDGFGGLQTVTLDVEIYDNGSLSGIGGFVGLDSTGGGIDIHDNPTLDHIDGFDTLISTGASFTVRSNPTLLDILGPTQLNAVHGTLEISDNRMLTTITGLAGVDTIDSEMRVLRNLVLTNLGGMTPTLIGTTLNVSANPAMSRCLVGAFATAVDAAVPGLLGTNISCCNNGCMTCTGNNCTAGPGGTTGQSGLYTGSIVATAPAQLAVFDNVTSTTGNLTISSSTFTSMAGLESLQTVSGDVTITSNQNLTSLTGLTNLTTISGDLTLQYNTNLMSVFGLSGLTTLGGHLNVYSNGITTLNGLSSLASIGEYVQIQYNGSLTSMDSLIAAINSVGGYVNVSQNTMLSTCAVSAFVASLSVYGGPTTSSGNQACAGSCNGSTCMP